MLSTTAPDCHKAPMITRLASVGEAVGLSRPRLSCVQTDSVGSRAFDVTSGPGFYVFPSRLPVTYYAHLLGEIEQRTAELRCAYPSGNIWCEFEAPDHLLLEACTLTDAALIQPLEAL